MITMQPGSSLVGAGGFNPHQGAAGSCIHPEEVALPWQWPSQSFILLICESWPGFVSKRLTVFSLECMMCLSTSRAAPGTPQKLMKEE